MQCRVEKQLLIPPECQQHVIYFEYHVGKRFAIPTYELHNFQEFWLIPTI